MWALGCLFWEILTGCRCFPGDDEATVLQSIANKLGPITTERLPAVGDEEVARPQPRWMITSLKKWLLKILQRSPCGGGDVLTESGADLMVRMLELDPLKRVSAE